MSESKALNSVEAEVEKEEGEPVEVAPATAAPSPDPEPAPAPVQAAAPAEKPASQQATPARVVKSAVVADSELKRRVMEHLTDERLKQLLMEMPADDQTWVFYALISDAANRREALAINHLRDLLNGGTIEGFVEKHLSAELGALRNEVGLSLRKIDGSIIELREIEDEKSLDSMAQLVARKVKIDLANQVNELASDLGQQVDRLVKLQKAQSGDVELMTRKVSETVSGSVAKKLGNHNFAMLAGCALFAVAFGVMLGMNISSRYSHHEIQTIVRMTATETVEQMQTTPAALPSRNQTRQ